jgi:hypothetical protein
MFAEPDTENARHIRYNGDVCKFIGNRCIKIKWHWLLLMCCLYSEVGEGNSESDSPSRLM